MSLKIETAFPGGNVFIEDINGFEVRLARDLRNTEGDWFYWAFRALFDQEGEYRFSFSQPNSCTSCGPAVSYDNGMTWEWLGGECVSGERNIFTYSWDASKNRAVIFCVGMQYLPQHLEAFLTRRADSPYLSRHILTHTRKNREVVRLHLEDPAAPGPKKQIFLSARNHCCEMMANYAMEGFLESVLADDDFGKLMRSKYTIDCVPFVDTDGVIDGDQGKNRRPHDHNRDYGDHPIYPEVAALQEFLLTSKPFFALDLHCPWLHGDNHEHILLPLPEEESFSRNTGRFSQILEEKSPQEAPHFTRYDIPFGTRWNTGKNYAQGMTCARWIRNFCQPEVGTTIEIPYAKATGVALTANAVRAFGRAVAESLLAYDCGE